MSEERAPSAPPESMRSKARSAVPFVAASGLVGMVASLLGLLLLVRYLPQAEYGVWVLLSGLFTPISLFTSFGFTQSLLRFMPARTEQQERSELLWAVIGRRMASAALAALALVAGFPWLAPYFGVEGHFLAFLAVQPAIVILAGSTLACAGLNVAFRQREVFLASLTQQVLTLLAFAAGIVLRQPLEYFAAAFSVVSAAHLAVALRYCVRYFGAPRFGALLRRPPERSGEASYRRTSWVNEIADNLLSSDLNRYLLAAFSTTAEVATYVLAASLVQRLASFQPMEIFRPLATVSVFERFERSGEIEDLNRTFHFLYGMNHLVTILYIALFLPLGTEALVWVFRAEYAAAYLPALFMFFSIGLFGMPVGLLANALKRPQYLLYARVAVLLNVGLGIPLAARYGASGMAFAVMVSLLVRNVITYVLLRLEFNVRFPWAGFSRFVLAGAVAAAVSWLAARVVPLPVALALGSLAYLLCARGFGVLDPWERGALVSLFPNRMQRAARLLVGT